MKQFKHTSKFYIYTLVAGLAGFCTAVPSAYGIGDTNEVWVSARTNALRTGTILGTGAITNPYYGDFDGIINSLSTNTTIHLLPGIHYTGGYESAGGDVNLKAGQRIIGAGIDTTIVRRYVPIHPDTGQNLGEFYTSNDGVEISDLTVDASGSTTNYYKNDGIILIGNNCSVRRVKVIGCSGLTSSGGSPLPYSFAPRAI